MQCPDKSHCLFLEAIFYLLNKQNIFYYLLTGAPDAGDSHTSSEVYCEVLQSDACGQGHAANELRMAYRSAHSGA